MKISLSYQNIQIENSISSKLHFLKIQLHLWNTNIILFQLHAAKTFCVEKNPVRSNIMYIFEYVNKNKGLDEIFQPIIDEFLLC